MNDSEIKLIEPDKDAYPNAALNYYYDHARHVEKFHTSAQSSVPSAKKKLFFLRLLIDTPSKALLFATIIVLCAVLIVMMLL